jgi:lysophospholipase L1-like esterase
MLIRPFSVSLLALALGVAGLASAQTSTPNNDDRPVEDATKYKLDVKSNPALPTIYIIGDSTVRVGTKGQRGWGDEIAPYFDLSKVNVVNHAIGGRSSRTFITEGRWAASLAQMRKGDAVLMQFGHNDAGAINAEPPGSKMPLRARASLKGIGDETQEIDNVLTKQHEVVHTYGWYIRKYIRDAKAKGVTPVVCSLIPRKSWKDETTMNRSGAGGYGGWAHEVADQEGALFIDLNDIIATGYEKLGKARVEKLFADSGTHTTVEGAQFNARAVVAGLKGLPGDPFRPYFSTEARDVPAYTTKKFTSAKP